MENEVMTREQAAQMLHVSPKTIDYWVVTQQIPFSRLEKRSVRFFGKKG